MTKKAAERTFASLRKIVGDTRIKIEENWREDEGGVPYNTFWIYAYPEGYCVIGIGFTLKGALDDFKKCWAKREEERKKLLTDTAE